MKHRVADYAAHRVLCLPPDCPVDEAVSRLAQADVTGAPVVDSSGQVVGVLSLTDLIALQLYGPTLAGRRATPDEDATHQLDLRLDLPVGDAMTATVWSAAPEEPLAVAAARMLEAQVHRLVVLGPDQHVRGILSTLDVMRAVRDAELDAPCHLYATSPVRCVEHDTPVSDAMEQLLEEAHHGMPVTDQGWPVGLLTQAELVNAREFPPETPVEEIATREILCVEENTPLWSAAAQGIEQGVRRLLVVRGRQLTGILVSLDFTRAYAELSRTA